MQARLAIVLDDGASRELRTVVLLSDPNLLRAAACRAVESAYQQAAQQPNVTRAAFQKASAVALWCTLARLIPELQETEPRTASVTQTLQ
jgi:hypothetical protein